MAATVPAPDSGRFDVIPYSDLSPESTWTRLGRGSFGCVFRGLYLGLDVAIKEVMNSDEYDVDKYFKRECTLMKECRHPNIVQFIGLSLAPLPPPDYLPPLAFDNASTAAQSKTLPPRRRILIISEYLPNGNLRTHIHNTRLDFSWRLRLSFSVDVARAVAYLHARNCLHRDLKGENLLITENDRIKVCDFGFARLAARNEEEMRRMSYCGTDGYMSPEILTGEEFGLETDIFSLGVIFCEILARQLVDDYTFKRTMPTFGLDASEIRDRASPGCPPAFLELAISCVAVEAADRPKIRYILEQLRSIEREVIDSEAANGYHVGSMTFGAKHAGRQTTKSSKMKRPQPGRIPSFQGQIPKSKYADQGDGGESSSDEDVEETLAKLQTLRVGGKRSIYLNSEASNGTSKLVGDGEDDEGKKAINYSVIKGNKSARSSLFVPTDEVADTSSILTVRAIENGGAGSTTSLQTIPALPEAWLHPDRTEEKVKTADGGDKTAADGSGEAANTDEHAKSAEGSPPVASPVDTMPGSLPESKFATIRSLSMPIPATPETIDLSIPPTETGLSPHRFTLVKPGWKALWEGGATEKLPSKRPSLLPDDGKRASIESRRSIDVEKGVHPGASSAGGLAAILPMQLLGAGLLTRCTSCEKRLGLMKPYLACDDCQSVFHVRCGDVAAPDCNGGFHAAPSSPNIGMETAVPKEKTRKNKRESKKLTKFPSNGST